MYSVQKRRDFGKILAALSVIVLVSSHCLHDAINNEKSVKLSDMGERPFDCAAVPAGAQISLLD